MGLSSSRLLYLALSLCFAVVAFLPSSKAARWLDLALAPTRVLGELASPIGMFARRQARAAEKTLADATESEHAESRKLALEERLFALPDEESLIAQRRFVHAQVVRRYHDAPDRVECVLEDEAGPDLVVGLPVVLSNSYVGRVAAVDLESGRLTVHLVTDKDFRVGALCAGAVTGEPPIPMVVGGLESGRNLGTPLSLHNPAQARGLSGQARVSESLNPRELRPDLCEGFLLGRLAEWGNERFAIQPEIDFANGLFRVVVVLPPATGADLPARDLDQFAESYWRGVRAYSACDPAQWREGVKIDYPRSAGARPNAAVVAGARLVGFVSRAGALESDVALLGDPGLSVPAQARVDGELAPLVLGHLIALGREFPGGPARFLWNATEELPPAADGTRSRTARLFTGAGELGVPRGLLIGDCLLPCAVGPQVIEVRELVDTRLLRRLWVWRGILRDELESGGLP
ncbi:MAG TPA: rod shape-determining protein MreC [Planctomycetota bacterium]|nr:rod shape-determining protein MreC [Planctomycetota bacterium]